MGEGHENDKYQISTRALREAEQILVLSYAFDGTTYNLIPLRAQQSTPYMNIHTSHTEVIGSQLQNV